MRYKQNKTCFETIDNEQNSYILGLLYADGNNYVSEQRSKISLVLHRDDKYLLDKINKIIGSERPIQISNNTAVLHVAGRKYSEDLIKLGCVPRKSLILQFPNNQQVPASLLSHFIRGYFDGDGCVHQISNNKKAIGVTIVGNEDFLSVLQRFLEDKKITCSIYKTQSKISQLRIFRKESVRLFYDLIYKESSIKMTRKYNKFVNHFNN